jgi:hypothetical protein
MSTFASKDSLDVHIKLKHAFTPNTCNRCDDSRVLDDGNEWKRHQRQHDNEMTAQRCPRREVGCTMPETQFNSKKMLKRHLSSVHRMSTSAISDLFKDIGLRANDGLKMVVRNHRRAHLTQTRGGGWKSPMAM